MNVGDRCGLRAKEGIGKKQTREEGEIRKMSVFRRGKVYWFSFVFNGQRIQQSTKQSNRKAAIDIESAYRTKLAKGEVGIEERKPAPTFREFSKRFIAHMKIWCKDKPKTFEFWEDMTNGLLEFEPLASARLDKIDEALLARFVARDSKVSIATVNRRLATLRRALRLAYEWRLLNRLPRIHMMPGEKRREYVLTAKDREVYLAATEEPLRSLVRFLLETGLRLGEALDLQWEDVHLDPVGEASRGYVHIRKGKSRNAKRNVSLTLTARNVLIQQKQYSMSPLVFVRDDRITGLSRTMIRKQHHKARIAAKLPAGFVVHSLRHTMLTNLGMSGADAFTIQKIAGHSSVIISERYIHPTPDSLERAFERLEAFRSSGATTDSTTRPNEETGYTM
jgi:integrase